MSAYERKNNNRKAPKLINHSLIQRLFIAYWVPDSLTLKSTQPLASGLLTNRNYNSVIAFVELGEQRKVWTIREASGRHNIWVVVRRRGRAHLGNKCVERDVQSTVSCLLQTKPQPHERSIHLGKCRWNCKKRHVKNDTQFSVEDPILYDLVDAQRCSDSS